MQEAQVIIRNIMDKITQLKNLSAFSLMGIIITIVLIQCSGKADDEFEHEARSFYQKYKDKDFSIFKGVSIYPRENSYLIDFKNYDFVYFYINMGTEPSQLPGYLNIDIESYKRWNPEFNMSHDEIISLITEIYREFSNLNVMAVRGYSNCYDFIFSESNRIYYVPDPQSFTPHNIRRLKSSSAIQRFYFDENWFISINNTNKSK
jgi:hypothetical protein